MALWGGPRDNRCWPERGNSEVVARYVSIPPPNPILSLPCNSFPLRLNLFSLYLDGWVHGVYVSFWVAHLLLYPELISLAHLLRLSDLGGATVSNMAPGAESFLLQWWWIACTLFHTPLLSNTHLKVFVFLSFPPTPTSWELHIGSRESLFAVPRCPRLSGSHCMYLWLCFPTFLSCNRCYKMVSKRFFRCTFKIPSSTFSILLDFDAVCVENKKEFKDSQNKTFLS